MDAEREVRSGSCKIPPDREAGLVSTVLASIEGWEI
jgi:hypothetical protein